MIQNFEQYSESHKYTYYHCIEREKWVHYLMDDLGKFEYFTQKELDRVNKLGPNWNNIFLFNVENRDQRFSPNMDLRNISDTDITDIQYREPSSQKDMLNLFHILKRTDLYFIVCIVDRDRDIFGYYKCDTLKGLSQCLSDYKSNTLTTYTELKNF